MSVIVNRRISIHSSPRMSLRFPSTMSSAPMLKSWIPRPRMYSRALWTFSHFCTRSRGLDAYLPRDSLPRISRRWMSSTWGKCQFRGFLKGRGMVPLWLDLSGENSRGGCFALRALCSACAIGEVSAAFASEDKGGGCGWWGDSMAGRRKGTGGWGAAYHFLKVLSWVTIHC